MQTLTRIEANVATGEVVEVPLTEEEIADAMARTAAEREEKARLAAEGSGPTPAEVTAARTALDALVTAGVISMEARRRMSPPPIEQG